MRLVCPNCDAEYEVDDAAIPLEGRDVQCSSCGHAWFQTHPETLSEDDLAEDDLPEPVVEPEPEEAPPPPPAPEPVAELPRRSIDDSVLAVLREEAEREAAARRGERPRIETQTEMTLPEAPRVAPVAPVVAEPPPEPQSKRALLPEIEEIKSSLNPGQHEEEDEAPQASPERAGFRRGFVLTVFVAVLLMALYVMAPVIAAKVPALAGLLEAYVGLVNALRRMLDAELRGLIGWLKGLAGSQAG